MVSTHYKILVVDDEEQMRKLIASLLSTKGHQCITARNGLEALDKITENKFNAVITDVVMPEMDGLTLTKELVKRSPNLPIMIMTGHGGEYSPESALKAGAREFVKKPFSLPEFIIRFDKMMRDHETLFRLKEERDKMLFHSQREFAEKTERLRKKIATYEGRWSLYYDPELD